VEKNQKLNEINDKTCELLKLTMENSIKTKSNDPSEIAEILDKTPNSEKTSTTITKNSVSHISKTKRKKT